MSYDMFLAQQEKKHKKHNAFDRHPIDYSKSEKKLEEWDEEKTR